MAVKVKSFEEIISEMSVAGYGDWSPSKEMIGTKSAIIVKNKWKYIQKFTTRSNRELTIYKSPKKYMYIAGEFKKTSNNESLFEIDFQINLSERKSIQHSFKYKKSIMNVDGVQVKENFQGDAISYNVYKILAKHEGFNILGDETQYFGARRLWSRLSKSIDIIMDIIDIDKDIIVEKDVKVYHGDLDYEFDKRVWNYDDSKKDIRLILKDIK